jgi:4-alpha-glucanotransferase
MTTTHDLPTIAGWWSGTDIETRVALDLAPDKGGEQNERKKDRVALWRAFRNAGAAREDQPAPENTGPVADAAISYTAQSPAPLALIPVEDVLGLREQPNLPGTINEHPNWRRRMPEPASKMLDAPQVRARLKTLRER